MSIPTISQIAVNPDAANEYIVDLIGEKAELLAACRTALRYIENNERRMDGVPLDSGNALRAAIRKAEGTP